MPRSAIAPPVIQQIAVDQCDPFEHARGLDEDSITRLAASIQQVGLLQPITVVSKPPRFLVVSGNHRREAITRLHRDMIDAIVLPENTPREDILTRSLHENHLRRNESLVDTLLRIEALAAWHQCPFSKAATLAGISPGTVSKIQTSVRKLSPEALAFSRQHKIGISVCYDVARNAATAEQQLAWLTSHAAGTMSRDEIAKAAKSGSQRKPKTVALAVTIDGIAVRLTVPADTDYDHLNSVLASLKSQLGTHRKQGLPVRLLPELLH